MENHAQNDRLTERRSWLIALSLSALASPARATTSTGVTMEAVDHYHDPVNRPDIVCIAEADNFRNGLLNASGTIYTAGHRFPDDSVFDGDFFDKDKTGASLDLDYINFDDPVDGLAYVCLHGDCSDRTNQTCTSSSQCTSPAAGQRLPGKCIGNGPPNNATGWCAYLTNRRMYNGILASNTHGGVIDYTSGNVRWGESTNSGTWAGAGTNGGINFGLLSNSCGVRPGLEVDELIPLFAGMTVLGIVEPFTRNNPLADDVDAPARGTALSNAYKTNPAGSIGHAWADSIVGIPQNDGKDCPLQGSSYTYGGGHGMDGCGAQLTFTVDGQASYTYWNRDTENWNDAINNNNDSVGNGYWAGLWHCNYDCNTYHGVI